ncbi:hypothetical protein Drose_18045 [Dactylosporangium roseum]|uniref:Lipoprotein n=1 Tax=Dactylosporangium roseum TaxID=47989 RepID=A0ABY5ZCS4_9ACTN|nr:hypothetical protein [Dactylosporangium roseum]UWZ39936.1 hypothetical protein Drose_18045 [Dactylosporangium roseum]
MHRTSARAADSLRRHHQRRAATLSVRAGALLMLGTPALVACSPPGEPLLAVGRTEAGRPVAHVRLCAPDRDASIALYGAAEGDTVADEVWRVDNETDDARSRVIELGVVPAGWAAREPGPLSLRADLVYRLAGSTDPRAASVRFTLDDVARLGADEVRTVRERRSDVVTMSRTAYEHRADKAC